MLSKDALIDLLISVDGIGPELNMADCVLCMSNILREACETAGVDRCRIVVLGNRVSTERFRPKPQKNCDAQVIRTAFVGRLQEQKNLHGIASALAILRNEGWKVRLEVCGGMHTNEYLRQATSVLKSSEWRFRGSVPNRKLPNVFQRVDMYVGPSYFEGFQIPIIEALAAGKPCVVSDQPPANEIINPSLGALVDPSDPVSIAAGILNVKRRLNDSQEASRLIADCRARAVQEWDYLVISRKEAALYKQVMENRRKPSDL